MVPKALRGAAVLLILVPVSAQAQVDSPRPTVSAHACPSGSICDPLPFDAIYDVRLPTLEPTLARPLGAPLVSLAGAVEAAFTDSTSPGGVGVWIVLRSAEGESQFLRSSRSLTIVIDGRPNYCTAEHSAERQNDVLCPLPLVGRSVIAHVWKLSTTSGIFYVLDSMSTQ